MKLCNFSMMRRAALLATLGIILLGDAVTAHENRPHRKRRVRMSTAPTNLVMESQNITLESSPIQRLRILEPDTAKNDTRIDHLAALTAQLVLNNREIRTELDSLRAQMATIKSSGDGTSKGNKEPSEYTSCGELHKMDRRAQSGVYRLRSHLYPTAAFWAPCEMTVYGGGWTVVQSRSTGAQSFNKPMDEYERGFGNIAGEFWLGLEHLHDLTGPELNEVLLELEDAQDKVSYSFHGSFSIASKDEDYRIQILDEFKNFGAGDAFKYHAGSAFSTLDCDRDEWESGNCAVTHGGGWWYKHCDRANLNGNFLNPGYQRSLNQHLGMYWTTYQGPNYSLKSSRIMVRPRYLYHNESSMLEPHGNIQKRYGDTSYHPSASGTALNQRARDEQPFTPDETKVWNDIFGMN